MSDPTAPCSATAHDPEALCDELHAARLDKANLAREVDHLQRESAHAHERIAAAVGLHARQHCVEYAGCPAFDYCGECFDGSDPSYPCRTVRALTEGTSQ